MTAGTAPRAVEIIGVPMDLGGNRRGVDMGPSAIRYADLERRLRRMGIAVRDRGNLIVPDPGQERAHRPDPKAHFHQEIVAVAEELAERVADAVRRGAIPLVLGGDHSVAMGTLAGLARAGKRAGVIWMDAHPDINSPETTSSGNVHGMPFAVALGLASAPFPKSLRGSADARCAALVGIRDVDEGERDNIKRSGVTALTIADVDRLGMASVMERAIAVASRCDGIHLSLDMDVIDPNEAPGVGTPVRGGITYREAQLAMEMVAATGKLWSVEVTEVNPILDRANATASLAVELIASALGLTIL
ncbi:MAG TPA: arginase [Candidatus Limnocylindria bacterium]|nr:arginase [Candidatus Limnocylindria bacterium]